MNYLIILQNIKYIASHHYVYNHFEYIIIINIYIVIFNNLYYHSIITYITIIVLFYYFLLFENIIEYTIRLYNSKFKTNN